MKHRIDIPHRFAQDHSERALPTGDLVQHTKRFWTFDCTVEELEEWLSDATYYSDCAGRGWDIGPEAIGLQASARATVTRAHAALEQAV